MCLLVQGWCNTLKFRSFLGKRRISLFTQGWPWFFFETVQDIKGWDTWLYNHQKWVHASSADVSDLISQLPAETAMSIAFMCTPYTLGRGGVTVWQTITDMNFNKMTSWSFLLIHRRDIIWLASPRVKSRPKRNDEFCRSYLVGPLLYWNKAGAIVI